MTHLQVGQRAPEFFLPSHTEEEVGLADFLGDCNLVLAFFPLAWTPI